MSGLRIILAALLTGMGILADAGSIVDADRTSRSFYDPFTGIRWSYMLVDDGAILASSDGSAAVSPKPIGRLTIPPTLDDHPVTAIGDFAFYGCEGLGSVEIPQGVVSIGDFAFGGCTALQSVTFPETLKSVGEFAFSCTVVSSLYFGKNLTDLKADAFYGCDELRKTTFEGASTSVVLAAGALPKECVTRFYGDADKSLPKWAKGRFRGAVASFDGDCTGVAEVTVSETGALAGRIEVRGCAFTLSAVGYVDREEETSLCTDLEFFRPQVVSDEMAAQEVSFEAEEGESLGLDLPDVDRGKIRGRFVFDGVPFEFELYRAYDQIPPSIKALVGTWSYADGNGQTYIIAVDAAGVARMSRIAEDGAQSETLAEAELIDYCDCCLSDFAGFFCLPKADDAFGTSVWIAFDPEADANSFPALEPTAVRVADEDVPLVLINGVLWRYEDTSAGVIIKGAQSAAGSRFVGELMVPAKVGGKSVVGIADMAFYGWTGLTSVILPEGVVSIGEMAFGGCYGLQTVSLPTALQSIGSYAFGCADLREVFLGKNVKVVAENAFYGCSALTHVVIERATAMQVIASTAFPKGCQVTRYGQVDESLPDWSKGRFRGEVRGLFNDENGLGEAIVDGTGALSGRLTIGGRTFEVASLGLVDDGDEPFGQTFGREFFRPEVTCGGASAAEVSIAVENEGESVFEYAGFDRAKVSGHFTLGGEDYVFNLYRQGESVPPPVAALKGTWSFVDDDGRGYAILVDSHGIASLHSVDESFRVVQSSADETVLVDYCDECLNDVAAFFKTASGACRWIAFDPEASVESFVLEPTAIRVPDEDSLAVPVAFDACGGQVSPEMLMRQVGATYGTLPTPTRSGAEFLGWHTTRYGGKKVEASGRVGWNQTKLYAHWRTPSLAAALVGEAGDVADVRNVHTDNPELWSAEGAAVLTFEDRDDGSCSSLYQTNHWIEVECDGESIVSFEFGMAADTASGLLDMELILTVDGKVVKCHQEDPTDEFLQSFQAYVPKGRHSLRWTVRSTVFGNARLRAFVGNFSTRGVGAVDSVGKWGGLLHDFRTWRMDTLDALEADSARRMSAAGESGYRAAIEHGFITLARVGDDPFVADVFRQFGLELDYMRTLASGMLDFGSASSGNTLSDNIFAKMSPAIRTALSDLERIPSSWNGKLTFAAGDYPIDNDIFVDRADVTYIRAMLKAALAVGNLVTAYNTKIDYETLGADLSRPQISKPSGAPDDVGWGETIAFENQDIFKDMKVAYYDGMVHLLVTKGPRYVSGNTANYAIDVEVSDAKRSVYGDVAVKTRDYAFMFYGDAQSYDDDVLVEDRGNALYLTCPIKGDAIACDCVARATYSFVQWSEDDGSILEWCDSEAIVKVGNFTTWFEHQLGVGDKVRNAAALSTAKSLAREALQLAQTADGLVLGRGAGEFLFNYDLVDAADLAEMRKSVAAALKSLDGPVDYRWGDVAFGRVSLKELFGGNVTRSLVPANTAQVGYRPDFVSMSDPTLAGMLPDFTKERWVTLCESIGVLGYGPYKIDFLNGDTYIGSEKYNRSRVYNLPKFNLKKPGKIFGGWMCSETGRRYDDGMLIFNLAEPGETVTMTAIWE